MVVKARSGSTVALLTGRLIVLVIRTSC